MLQNAMITAYNISELLKENQQGKGVKITPPPPLTFPPRLGLIVSVKNAFLSTKPCLSF